MAASGDHALSPAHAHLNLVGFVTFAIFAFYYRLSERAAASRLAQAHLGIALLGLVLMVPGIVLAVLGRGETLAAAGSVITLLSMLTFLAVLFIHGFGETAAD